MSHADPYNFNAVLELGSYDCEYCGTNYNQLQAESDFTGFRLTDRTGCYNWTTVTVTDPQDAENTLRTWADGYLNQSYANTDDMNDFVAQVRAALDAYNTANAQNQDD